MPCRREAGNLGKLSAPEDLPETGEEIWKFQMAKGERLLPADYLDGRVVKIFRIALSRKILRL